MVTGLSSGTTYYYQAVATNSLGVKSYGSVLSFSTANVPSVVTSPATGVTQTAATLNGSVNSNGGSTTTSFCYSTSSAQTNCSGASSISATPSPVTGSTPSTISATLPSLSPGTTYYVQAVGTNSLGSPTYGALLSFTTAATPTAVSYTHLHLWRSNAVGNVHGTGNYVVEFRPSHPHVHFDRQWRRTEHLNSVLGEYHSFFPVQPASYGLGDGCPVVMVGIGTSRGPRD